MSRLYAELAVLLALAGATTWAWIEHDHAQRQIGAQKCEAEIDAARDQAAVKAQADRNAQEEQRQKAEEEHYREIHSIPVISTPIIVLKHVPTACVSVPKLPNSAELHSPSGSTDQGSGTVDIRPRIAAFELRYETALADARRIIASWPQECYTAPSP